MISKKLLTQNFGLIIVLVLSIVPLLSLLPEGMPITHDGRDHIARTANFYNSLSEGNLIPRWAENLNWGYGHPVMMFLYPLPSYFASFFHFLGFNLTDSVKLVFATSYIASGLAMYYWTKNQFDEYVGIATSVLYMYAPYRFIDLYVRGAIGEHLAFIFLPLTLYAILKFFKSSEIFQQYIYFVLTAASTAFLILSHNAMSIMFLPVIFFYLILLSILSKKKKLFIYILFALIIGFFLSAFFTLPAFFEGKYTLREIVTGNEYAARFVDFRKFFGGEWNYKGTGEFSTEIGLIHLIGFIVGPIAIIKLLKKERLNGILFLGMFLFFIVSVFLMLPIGNIMYELVTVMKKFQFPWRFLSLTIFTASIMSGMTLLLIKNKSIKKALLFLGIAFLILTSIVKFQANGYLAEDDQFYKGVYHGTTDTGESAPIWSVRFMEEEPDAEIEIIAGEARIFDAYRSSVNHSYYINVISDSARFRENTLYFPGWKVFVGKREIPIEFQDPSNRGLITFELPKGQHKVEIKFSNTKLRTISEMVSLAAFGFLILLGVKLAYRHVNKK